MSRPRPKLKTRPFGLALAFAALVATAGLGLVLVLLGLQEFSIARSGFKKITQFESPHARQAVAVTEDFLFGIDDSSIGQYDKGTGALLFRWMAPDESPIQHLNSGIVIDEKLIAAHSNYPDTPIRNSLESWSLETLVYAGTQKLSGRYGYAVWVDRFDASWWVAFAHYERTRPKTGKGPEDTTLVRFDDVWNEVDSWMYPRELIRRMAPKSNSGGAWGPHGVLYLTGHDAAEVYVVFPDPKREELTLLDIFPVDNAGQGIAWDPSDTDVLFAMKRAGRIVTLSKLEVSGFRRFRWGLIRLLPSLLTTPLSSSFVGVSSSTQ